MTLFENSLSRYIVRVLLTLSLVLVTVCYFLASQLQWSVQTTVMSLAVLSGVLSLVTWQFTRRITSCFRRALLHIEAIKMEDYNQIAKSEYADGVTADVHKQLTALSQQLQQHKSQYDQHAVLLYQLIDQLDTPVLVFNQRQLLTYANGAFSLLFGEPWQVYRQASPRLLGLHKEAGTWRITESEHNWQINQSEFIDDGERHLLLVFTNIDSALRASQLKAWQQIIRVLSHEIRNSLTPVSSLAESLGSKMPLERDKQALAVIAERCLHLQDFVERYTALSQDLNLDIRAIDISELCAQLRSLFPANTLTYCQQMASIKADPMFIQQVFINLIKNAFEAEANKVHIAFTQRKGRTVITVTDNGHGISNPDNLFVPLYTTKPQGQGIGLSFCRNIIEQHQGHITMSNHSPERSGACVTISLPIHS